MNDTTSSSATGRHTRISLNIRLPLECEPYKNDIRRFVNAMLYKLKINAFKGRWEQLTMSSVQAALSIEVAELNEAIEGGNTIDIMLEAADVANFALIIASMEVEGKND